MSKNKLATKTLRSQNKCFVENLKRVNQALKAGEVVLFKIEDKPALRQFYDSKLKSVYREYGELHAKIMIDKISVEDAKKALQRIDKRLSDYRKSLKA